MNQPAWIAVILAAALVVINPRPATADIDLDCGKLSTDTVDRLDAEGLLASPETGRQRAHAIILELCSDREATTQEQHEAGVKRALDNWFFEDRPDKAGNKRLKSLKR